MSDIKINRQIAMTPMILLTRADLEDEVRDLPINPQYISILTYGHERLVMTTNVIVDTLLRVFFFSQSG